MNDALFTSERQDWGTPTKFFEAVARKYGPFTLDVCASEHNAKCDAYWDEESDGLLQSWKTPGRAWCNPPYADVGDWISKGIREMHEHNVRSVFLVPARVDTKWFQHAFSMALAVEFVRGRLKFEIPGKASTSAPFPSALIFFEAMHEYGFPQVGYLDL